MKISFTKKEILHLLISALVLGLVFGFDDGREILVPRLWLANYMLMSCIGLVSLVVMVIGHKWAAGRYSVQTEYNIWGINRLGFKQSQYIHKKAPFNRIPLGIILPVALALLTEGKLWLASIGMILTFVQPEHRIGRKWINIPDYEEARI